MKFFSSLRGISSASQTSYSPAGNISATDMQSAITELDNEKAAKGTLLADYGVTDAYTKTQSDTKFAPLASPIFTGNVGIGTTPSFTIPGSGLHIKDTANTQAILKLEGLKKWNLISGGGGQFAIFNEELAANSLHIGSTGDITVGGRLGIGISPSPIYALDVVGSASFGTGGQTNAQHIKIGYDTANDYGMISSVHEGTAYTPLLLNFNGGNVGIGKVPTCALDVNGSASVSRGNMCIGEFMGVATSEALDKLLLQNYDTTESTASIEMNWSGSGQIGIGTTSKGIMIHGAYSGTGKWNDQIIPVGIGCIPQATFHSVGSTILGGTPSVSWGSIGNSQISPCLDNTGLTLYCKDASGNQYTLKFTFPVAGTTRTI